MYKESFSQKLKKARIEMGVTQIDVSIDTNISQGKLSKYENGKLEPSIENLGVLTDYYEISADWLLGTGKRMNKKNEK